MKVLNEISNIAVRLVFSGTVLSVVMAWMFYGISFLRTFGLPADTTITANQALGDSVYSGLLLCIEQAVFCYNQLFPGYARFGSGLGIIIAAVWTVGFVKKCATIPRIAGGFLCGSVIGGRAILMLSSSPRLLLFGMIMGGVVGAFYLYFAGRPSLFKPLPRAGLSQPVVE